MTKPNGSVRLGIAGIAGRGGNFARILKDLGTPAAAGCDVNEEKLRNACDEYGVERRYTSFEQMFDDAKLDAVILATPMQLHADQAVAALERGLHVLCEVPAAVSVEECRRIVEAAAKSDGHFYLAENYNHIAENIAVAEMVRQGVFGETYFADAEYLHDVTHYVSITPWRRHWQLGIDGLTYPTHSLGPVLRWMPGQRLTRVSCVAAGSHRVDAEGKAFCQDSPVLLGKTQDGRVIKLRVDLTSPRPHAATNYQLQGTLGCYESSRAGPGDRGKIWLAELSESPRWYDLPTLLATPAYGERFLPERYRNPPEAARKAGHGGGDFWQVVDFLDACAGQEVAGLVGLHEAMDLTLPGLISQESVKKEGAWLDVPDSRKWINGEPQGQLQMRWPAARVKESPEVSLPEGYVLRQFREEDTEDYLAIMRASGLADWTPEQLQGVITGILPNGFFVVEHQPTGRVVASAQARHGPRREHPAGGEVGWVVADANHKGKRLGRIVTAAAVARLLAAGYETVFLLTDDFRLPAVKSYLDIGFEPFPATDDADTRWAALREQLGVRA